MAVVLTANASGAQTPDVRTQQILASTPFNAATTFLEQDHDRFVSELIALTEIPSPPFKEGNRAAAFLEMLRGLGLSDVEMDSEGNVMGLRKGRDPNLILAIVAHLDTVFPEGTDVRVKRDGTRLMAPGAASHHWARTERCRSANRRQHPVRRECG